MSNENKPIRVEFAPGAFDDFEGTQEELDAFQKEIIDMFTNMTPDELAAQSRPLSESIDVEEDEEFLKSVLEKLSNQNNRNLQ